MLGNQAELLRAGDGLGAVGRAKNVEEIGDVFVAVSRGTASSSAMRGFGAPAGSGTRTSSSRAVSCSAGPGAPRRFLAGEDPDVALRAGQGERPGQAVHCGVLVACGWQRQRPQRLDLEEPRFRRDWGRTSQARPLSAGQGPKWEADGLGYRWRA